MSQSKDAAKDQKAKPAKDLSDKELGKASGGAGPPAPVGGPGTVPTPADRAKWGPKG